MGKRLMSVLLVCCMLVTVFPLSVFAVSIVDSGYCGGEGDGTNLTWEYDSNQRLTIRGHGKMADYGDSGGPWKESSAYHHVYSMSGGIVIEEGVTTIGNNAFRYCEGSGISGSPISVKLPKSLVSIGDGAFFSSDISGKISIPESVKYIGNDVFEDCTRISYIEVLNENANLCSVAGCLYDKSRETLIECPELLSGTLTILKETKYADDIIKNRALSKIEVEEGNVNYISFNDCLYDKDMTKIIKCPSNKQTELTFPDTLEIIGEYAFYYAYGDMGELWLPDSVTYISEYAFYVCRSFTNWLVIPDNVTYIGDCAFASRYADIDSFSNTYIIIPAKVTNIGDYAFSFNGDLRHIYMKGRAPTIGEEAFGWAYDYGDVIVYCLDKYYLNYQYQLEYEFSRDNYLLQTWSGNNPTNPTPPEPDEPPLKPDSPIAPNEYFYFGKLENCTYKYITDPATGFNKYVAETITIDGVTYTASETSGMQHIVFPEGGYLKEYYYVAYNLDESRIIANATFVPGVECTLEGWNATTKVVDTDLIPITSDENTLPAGNYYVSDATKDVFPSDEIGNWIGDKVRVYTNGEQIYKIIYITNGEGVVESYYYDDVVKIVINGTTYKVANDEKLIETIMYPFFNGSEYIKDARFTLYDDTIIDLQYINETLDPELFNEYIYHADIALTSTGSYEEYQGLLHGNIYTDIGTEADRVVYSAGESGFDHLVSFWEGATTVGDTIFEGPGGTVKKYAIEKVDIYTAIIMESLECSMDNVLQDKIGKVNTITKDVGEMLIDEDMGFFKNIDIKALNKVEKSKLAQKVTDRFADDFDLEDGDYLEIITLGLDVYDNVLTWLEHCANYACLLELSNEMHYIVNRLYEECPSSNAAMKSALKRCVAVLTIGKDNFTSYIMGSSIHTAGSLGVTFLADKMWEMALDAVSASFPVVLAVIYTYKACKFVINATTNIDGQSEAYLKILSLLEYETLARKVMDDLADEFLTSKTEKTAKLYLESTKVNFNILQTDAKYALDFYKEFESLPWTEKDVKEVIQHIETNVVPMLERYPIRFNNYWILWLERDYPELFEKYQDRLAENVRLVESMKIACPVNVNVYDINNNLVVYVKDGVPYASGNIAVVVENDDKYLYFYDDAEYKVVCDGYATGTMDIFLTQYDANEVISRTVNYIDIPVTADSVYNLIVGDDVIMDDTTTTVNPTYDSDNKGTAHTVTIINGVSTTNDTYETTITAYEGEVIEIATFMIGNETFTGWTADINTVVFDNSNNTNTSFVMIDNDVVIYANTINTVETQPTYYNLVPSYPTVTFEVDGGTTVDSLKRAYGTSINLPRYTTAKEGYIFTGWYTDKECTIPAKNFKLVKDTTLYAGWQEITTAE